MKQVVTLASLLLLAAASVEAQDTIAITRRATQAAPSRQPPREPRASTGPSNFTGPVRVALVFQSLAPGRATGSDVTFEPGARTAWHTHPGGQTLIVSAGVGRVQQWGAPAHEIRPGDVVRIPPGVKHWHGASPDSAMTHLAIVEPIDGRSVEWMEPVADSHYLAQPPRDQQAQPRPSGPVQQRIVPGMAEYTDEVLFGDVWRRPELSPRDRSLVTISVLIATGKPDQLQGHLVRALGNGVQPREASGVLTHLAIYSGWPSAVVALGVYDRVYTAQTSTRRHCARRSRHLPSTPGTPNGHGRRTSSSEPSRRSSRSSRTTSCSTTCGGGPTSACATAASSRSPRWPRRATTICSISTCVVQSRVV